MNTKSRWYIQNIKLIQIQNFKTKYDRQNDAAIYPKKKKTRLFNCWNNNCFKKESKMKKQNLLRCFHLKYQTDNGNAFITQMCHVPLITIGQYFLLILHLQKMHLPFFRSFFTSKFFEKHKYIFIESIVFMKCLQFFKPIFLFIARFQVLKQFFHLFLKKI